MRELWGCNCVWEAPAVSEMRRNAHDARRVEGGGLLSHHAVAEELAAEGDLKEHVQVDVVLEGGEELGDVRVVGVAHDRALLQRGGDG